ncbi:hypothetical protein [Mucilaginibacter lappiensis]|uniref:Uncharacterized protein n=1 Tax=Mucilaginibacter lappiensis TaxID=354630 RepID=A0A841J6F4_9SPHI|nr:hypothetical protein [Mucilaginibacter lappiensis]MBB6126354.1 hypothetical protein [Mucilaginibacter lappiensis]
MPEISQLFRYRLSGKTFTKIFYRTTVELYWFDYQGKLYPFRWVIRSADIFDGHAESPTHPIFRYYQRWLHDIADRGFHLRYQDRQRPFNDPAYWIAAPFYGSPKKLEDQLADFLQRDLWGTYHERDTTEGRKIYSLLAREQSILQQRSGQKALLIFR